MKGHSLNLLEGPILSRLVQFAAPFLLTSLFTTVYTLTDLFWIGRLSSEAVAAVGIVGFLTWMGDAIGMGMRTGMGVITAQRYGKGASESEIERSLSAGFQVALGAAIFYSLLAQFIVSPFATFFRLGDHMVTMAVAYGRVVFLGMIFKMLHFTYAQAFQSFGNSSEPFRINLIGLLLNVVMDPLLIFGWGPIPAWGVQGAALATAISQITVLVSFWWKARAIAKKVSFQEEPTAMIARVGVFRRDTGKLAREVIRIGFPVALLGGTFCVINFVLDRLLATFGALAVAVATIGSQLESINWMTSDGFGSALTAMAAQNIGEAERESLSLEQRSHRIQRIDAIIRTGITLMVSVGLAVMTVFLLFGDNIFGLFLPGNAEGIAVGATYLFIFAFSEPFMALESSSGAAFNAYGKTVPPAAISVIFNLLRIPLALCLMPCFHFYGVWIAMSVSSILKGNLIFLLYRKFRKRKW